MIDIMCKTAKPSHLEKKIKIILKYKQPNGTSHLHIF